MIVSLQGAGCFVLRQVSSVLLISILSGIASGQTDPLEKSARAILETKCAACHGPARMSDLDLRESTTALKGGKRGPAIVPGKADESLLYKAVRREGDLQMPPGKSALTAAEVDAIRDWINAGAVGTSTTPEEAGASWWSFKKPVRPAVPAVKDAAAVRNPIDAFILAKLEQKGLQPAPEADRRTLVRRAYFDLHGLPPTPEQVDEFVNDKSPDAYEKLIDRLLASPRYGERWGRYWLDLVRYADTSGFETDHFFITAWRYRDWVIESFNRDKPYTTFVQEQIAADEIWPDEHGPGRHAASCPKRKRRTSTAASARACSRSARSRSSSPTTATSSAPNGRRTRWIRSAPRFSA